jgi:hypothetical protein
MKTFSLVINSVLLTGISLYFSDSILVLNNAFFKYYSVVFLFKHVILDSEIQMSCILKDLC